MKNLTNKMGIIAIGAVIMFGLVLIGCATTVPTYAVKAPTIDTSEIQKLQIKDFTNTSGVSGSDVTQIVRYLSEQTAGVIRSAGFFTLVNDSNAEGIFTGEVRVFTKNDSQGLVNQYNLVTKETTQVMQYRRDVELEFAYSVTSKRTGVEINKIVKKGTTYDTTTTAPAQLADTVALAKRIVDKELKSFKGDVVPTLVVASKEKLMQEKANKDKTLQQFMKTADGLVKNGKFEQALKQYNEIYDKYESEAAKYNAGLLVEAIKAKSDAEAKLAALYSDKDGVAEKAVKKAVDAIAAKLPAGSNVMIMKQKTTEPAMLDFVLDNMVKTIVQGGKITVIDRSNQALIDAEQKFQMSGNVDDASSISIGKQLGVRYAVMCWISGTGSERKLNIKVLDIQTSGVTVQDNFDI